MIRTFLFCVLFVTAVSANDIYVTQSQTAPQSENTDTQGFTEPQTDQDVGSAYQQPESGTNFEKSLIPVDTSQYCSVIAGCLESQ